MQWGCDRASTDGTFRSVAAELYSATMGTEAVAELLYGLIVLVRPVRVLEIGGGYTTLFILRAVADSVLNYEREAKALSDRRGPDDGNAAPRLLLRSYYTQPYAPRVVMIDDMSHPASTAARVRAVAARAGCGSYLDVVGAKFPEETTQILNGITPIDFAWLDCGSRHTYAAFVKEVWPRMSTDGGIVAIHSTETNAEGQRFMQELRRRHAGGELGPVEVCSLLEPHKSRQNSVSLFRFVGGLRQRLYTRRA